MTTNSKANWLIPTGLLLLSAVPSLAGASRVAELTGGGDVTPDNARFFDMPVPVLIHIFAAVTYAILGAFQFAPGWRRRRPDWHRAAGWVLIPAGVAVALTGLWMTAFYRLPPSDGTVLNIFRCIVGVAMLAEITLGVLAIRRRDIPAHRAWMIRAYALALGAGTQVFTHVPWLLVFGVPSTFTRAWLMFAGWAVNVLVAEWFIAKPARRRSRRPLPQR